MARQTLTNRQKRFIDEYLIDLNATRAAIRAGYSPKTAEWIGPQQLTKNHVAEAVAQRMKDRAQRTQITQDRVLKEFARIAFFDPRKLFRDDGTPRPINELDDDTAAAIAGLDVSEEFDGSGPDRVFVGYTKKYKVSDKKGALDSVARHLGMFNDKMALTGKDGEDLSIAVRFVKPTKADGSS